METGRREFTNTRRRDWSFQKRHPNRSWNPAPPRINRHHPRPRYGHVSPSRAPPLAQLIAPPVRRRANPSSVRTCGRFTSQQSRPWLQLVSARQAKFTRRGGSRTAAAPFAQRSSHRDFLHPLCPEIRSRSDQYTHHPSGHQRRGQPGE